ncbi:beta-1,3-glucan-binding protein [Patella vulgata]|uniref:beta-1,3-glucan-binding protein n=1 Tax=Patella vulgata TaxID=6465 RepID=UPI00217F3D5F|nr:beta-1,3-glucan-binding protein [Patella vulgata]
MSSGNTPKPTPRPTPRPVTKAPTDHHPDNTNTGNHQNIQHGGQSTSTRTQQSSCTSYPCLVFEDNFDYLDVEVWEHELTLGGGGNWEFEYYTNNRSNSYVRNGILYLKPTLTADAHDEAFLQHGTLDLWGAGPYDTCTGNAFYGCSRTGGGDGHILNPIQSAKLRSSRGFNVKYGKVEVEAKLPTGDWIWPAIWMMPTYDAYGGWPTSGEIDIMESRGNVNYKDDKGQAAGVDSIGSTLHFGPNWQQDAWPKATANKRLNSNSGTFGDRFYRYGVEWDEHSIRFTVDDEVILNVTPDDGGFWKYGGFDRSGMANPWQSGNKMAPFDQKFFIILNVAVGGMNYFPDSFTGPRPKPWKEADSKAFWQAKNQWYPTWNPHVRNGEDAAMQINYVKVWKMKP